MKKIVMCLLIVSMFILSCATIETPRMNRSIENSPLTQVIRDPSGRIRNQLANGDIVYLVNNDMGNGDSMVIKIVWGGHVKSHTITLSTGGLKARKEIFCDAYIGMSDCSEFYHLSDGSVTQIVYKGEQRDNEMRVFSAVHNSIIWDLKNNP